MSDIIIYNEFDPTKLVLDEKFSNSNYSVMVVATFKKDGEIFKIIRFPVDQLVFVNILLVISTRCFVFQKLSMRLLHKLAGMVNEGEDTGNEFYGLILKCICCWQEAFRVYVTLPPQDLGFVLTIDMDNLNRSILGGGTVAEAEEALQSILNNNQNN